jgi:hypothetical protein
MAERNSSSTGTTRGSERGNTAAASASGATASTAQQNTERTSSPAWQQGERASGSEPQSRGGIVDTVRERASAQLTTQKDRALDGLGGVADAVRKTTQSLREHQHETLAGYVEQAADQIERFSRNLKNKDVGELVRDAQGLARRQPALFVGSAFAIGLLGARFFKSSSPDRGMNRRGAYGSGYRTDSERSAYGAGTYGTERF